MVDAGDLDDVVDVIDHVVDVAGGMGFSLRHALHRRLEVGLVGILGSRSSRRTSNMLGRSCAAASGTMKPE